MYSIILKKKPKKCPFNIISFAIKITILQLAENENNCNTHLFSKKILAIWINAIWKSRENLW